MARLAGPNTGLSVSLALGFALAGIADAPRVALAESDREIASLRETLFEEALSDPRGLRLREEDPGVEAIDRLTQIASEEAIALLEEFLKHPKAGQKRKTRALVALGRIAAKDVFEGAGQAVHVGIAARRGVAQSQAGHP